MRVGLFCIVIFLSLCRTICAAQGFTLAVNCGAGGVKMTGYNDTINSANAYNTSLGIISKLKILDTGISPEIILGYDLVTPVGLAGVYLKNGLILLNDSGSAAKWPDKIIAQSINSDLSVMYTGLGARISFASEIIPSLAGYAGVDLGLCHYYWNYIAEETYKANGDNLYRIRKEWQTAVPGMSAEAGIDWWFAGNMGVSVKGGCRLAAGKVMVKIINISGWAGASEGEDYMDYSGFYGNAGLVFRFEQREDGRKNPVKGGQFPAIALWLYNEAQDLYAEGLYRQAAQKIKEAEDTAQGNAQIEELKEKIQAVLKTEINAGNVKKLLKEADEFKDRKDYKKARMRYSEAANIDPENKQAKFNLDEFASKAAENYALAAGLKNKGSLKEALLAAKLAYDYGGGEEAWGLKNELQSQLKNKKDQDRLYNEGVEQFQKGDYKKAAESWAEVVSIDPDDSEAAANMEKARKKMAAEAGDEKAGVSSALVEAKNLYSIGNMDEAVKKCELVLRMDDGNTTAAKILADIKKVQDENKKEVLNKR